MTATGTSWMFSRRFCAVTMISVKVGGLAVSARAFPTNVAEIATNAAMQPRQAAVGLDCFGTATFVVKVILILLRRVHSRLRDGDL
jgi:hypothetical protein